MVWGVKIGLSIRAYQILIDVYIEVSQNGKQEHDHRPPYILVYK